MLARIYDKNGKPEEAEKQLRTFVEESPNSLSAHRIRSALAKMEQRRAREERREVEQELEKKRVEQEKMERLNQLFADGVEALSAGNYEVAISQLEEAAQLAPEQPAVFANLGEAYLKAGRSKRGTEAQALLQKSAETHEKAVALRSGRLYASRQVRNGPGLCGANFNGLGRS